MGKESSLEYGKDEYGQEVLLKEGKFQVMMQWEKPYMRACIDALKPFGDVLEIGFGLAYSAERIQEHHPKSHTIIECDPEVAAKAREWAKNYPNVRIIEETWQNALSNLGVFDCIFFDDYPLQSEEQMCAMKTQSAQSTLLLQAGNKLLAEVTQQLPFLNTIQYSDEDLQGLMGEIAPQNKEQALQCARFLMQLRARGQITQTQLHSLFTLLEQEKHLTAQELSALTCPQEEKKGPFSFSRSGERLLQFLSACLKSHMRQGSRFSCFLSSPVSKFEDAQFVEEVIANPFLEFHEEEIEVEVPQNCKYFTGNKALVITIQKMI